MARLLDHRRRQRSRVQAWPGDRTPCRRPGARNRKGRARPDAGRAQDSGLNEKGEKGMIRSEEHTSELQSLMRISYAVLCLKKKRNRQPRAHMQLRLSLH